jgi:hypothetical protein
MTERTLEQHINYITESIYNQLEETGRFKKLSNPILPEILREIYQPIVRTINRECNERIDLYQQEIKLLKKENENLKRGFKYIGSIEFPPTGKHVNIYWDRMEH